MSSVTDVHLGTLDPPEKPKPGESVFPIMVTLYTGNTYQREQATLTLIQKRDPRIIQLLINMMGSKSERVSVLSYITLLRFGRRAVNLLISSLNHPEKDVRRKVVLVLLQLRDVRSVDALIKCLRHDPDAKVRRYAACALGLLRQRRAIKPLINALADSDERVRWDAAVALAKLETQAIPSLIIAAQHEPPLVRQGAINALAWIRDRRAVTALVSVLDDSYKDIRSRAAFALGWIGDEGGVKPLTLLLHDRYAEVRMQAVVSLGWMRDPAVIPALLPLLNDVNEWVGYAVIEALTTIGTPEAQQALVEACRHDNPFIAEAAQKGVLQLGINPPVLKQQKPTPASAPWLDSADQLSQRRCQLVITPNAHSES